MGRIFEHQEIINTPEAKGMRTLPSSRGVVVNFSELKAKRENRLMTPHQVPHGREVGIANFFKLKSQALTNQAPAYPAELLQFDSPITNELDDVSSLGLTADFAGLDDSNWTPPDCQIAVGPNHVLAAVNATFAVFDKFGAQLLRRTLADVFARLVEDAIIYNPKVLYDQFHGGWVMAACARSFDSQRSWFLLAYSKTENPLGDWRVWALDAGCEGLIKTAYWPDSLGLAVDNSLLYLTANMFSGQGEFVYSKLRILNLREVEIGSVVHGWDFWQLRNADGSPAFGIQPAVNLRAAGAQYLLNSTSGGQGFTQWTVTQPMRQAPVLTRRFVPTAAYHLPPDAHQHSTGVEIEIGDARLVNVVFRHGLLWAAHTVAANWGDATNTAAIHWVQINPRAGCVIQQGIYGAPRRHYFCPAVMVDGEANLVMVFNRVSEYETPSICFTGRRAADESGMLHPSELLMRSPASAFCQWSNFNGAAIAPDESEIWVISQYVATETDLPTWIGAIRFVEEAETADGFPAQTVYA
ncbi:MAG: hypothetical protein JNK38_06960 [Acidobacteria bacterium]|nr:hypothetical protein [Acidobacteriota bacterium]